MRDGFGVRHTLFLEAREVSYCDPPWQNLDFEATAEISELVGWIVLIVFLAQKSSGAFPADAARDVGRAA